jgi:hypothetical protein
MRNLETYCNWVQNSLTSRGMCFDLFCTHVYSILSGMLGDVAFLVDWIINRTGNYKNRSTCRAGEMVS